MTTKFIPFYRDSGRVADGYRWHSAYADPDCKYKPQNIEWRENSVFNLNLEYCGIGNSKTQIQWRDTDSGEVYNMFRLDLDKLLESRDIINKKVSGEFQWIMRGNHYGIRLADG